MINLGDAIVYGTMNNNKDWHPPQKIRIYGHGTLSGDRIPHPTKDDPIVPSSDRYKYHPIDIVGAEETFIEGITIANSAFHSIMMPSSYNLDKRTEIKWVKIFTWRPNGDGINPFGIILVIYIGFKLSNIIRKCSNRRLFHPNTRRLYLC